MNVSGVIIFTPLCSFNTSKSLSLVRMNFALAVIAQAIMGSSLGSRVTTRITIPG